MDNYFEELCIKLNLGKLESFSIVEGGLTNKMYKLRTTDGEFAIKIINKDNILKNPELLNNIELSEDIACTMLQNNINTVPAIKFNNKYIVDTNDDKLLIYNWFNGRVLLTKELTLSHVETIAISLANIHKVKIKHNIESKKYKKIDYKKYYDLLRDNKEECFKSFIENFDKLSKIYDKVYSCYSKLSNQKSYVHKDLNRKNIMWDNDTPYIIDWETSTVGNPSLDFFNSAWFLTADVDYNKYYVFAKEYFKFNKLEDDINVSVYAAIIDECNWLEYSLKRALRIQSNDKDEIDLGKRSIQSSLGQILDYYDKIPLMIKIIEKVKSEINR